MFFLFSKINFSYRSVPTNTINGLFLYRTNGIGSSNRYHKRVTDRTTNAFCSSDTMHGVRYSGVIGSGPAL
jgi:hypothetical protein